MANKAPAEDRIGVNQMCETQEIHCPKCVPPDTFITADIPVPIKELSEGDKIADTRLGKTQIANRISKVFTHQYDGDLIIVKPQGCLPLELTPEHEVLILPAEKVNYGKHRVKLGQPTWVKAIELTRRPDPCKPYSSGHYLVMPVRKGSYGNHRVSMAKFTTPHGQEILKRRKLSHFLPLNESIAWLIGLYVADGNVSKDSLIQISLHSSEVDKANRVLTVSSTIGLKASIKPIENEKAIAVLIYSRVLSRALKEWCGDNAKNKRIPKFILDSCSDKLLQAFLKGYIDGDGSRHESKQNLPTIQAKTVSRVLALQIQVLCARLGQLISIREVDNSKPSYYKGKEIRGNGKAYGLDFFAGPVGELLGLEQKPRRLKYGVKADYIGVPISKIDRKPYIGSVMNLTTTLNSYCVNNVIVHNCGRFFGYQAIMLGVVKLKCPNCKEWTTIEIMPEA